LDGRAAVLVPRIVMANIWAMVKMLCVTNIVLRPGAVRMGLGEAFLLSGKTVVGVMPAPKTVDEHGEEFVVSDGFFIKFWG